MKRLKAKLGVFRYKTYKSEYDSFLDLVNNYSSSNEFPVNNLDIWKKKLTKVAKYGKAFMDVATGFFKTKLRFVSKKEFADSDPIVVCVVKNDLDRIKVFVDYYRKFGIKHFAFLDDKSTDGTREYLISLNDADVIESDESYTTNMRQSWINRIIAYYGLDKWFLVFDSDELLTTKYTSIDELLFKTSDKDKFRCLMVDMYPIDGQYSDDFVEKYRGFDTNTYLVNNSSVWFNCISGGMRRRVFSVENNTINPYLIKTPVFKSTKSFVQLNSHFNYPFSYDKDFYGIIRHYKFLKNDFEKYQERAEKGNFANGSQEYVSYMNKGNSLSIDFKYDGTKEFINYDSFFQIDIFKKNKHN